MVINNTIYGIMVFMVYTVMNFVTYAASVIFVSFPSLRDNTMPSKHYKSKILHNSQCYHSMLLIQTHNSIRHIYYQFSYNTSYKQNNWRRKGNW